VKVICLDGKVWDGLCVPLSLFVGGVVDDVSNSSGAVVFVSVGVAIGIVVIVIVKRC
jgi:hypothetical protein